MCPGVQTHGNGTDAYRFPSIFLMVEGGVSGPARDSLVQSAVDIGTHVSILRWKAHSLVLRMGEDVGKHHPNAGSVLRFV
jgi:hypothetical protein